MFQSDDLAYQRWRERLATYRQDWPEWAALERHFLAGGERMRLEGYHIQALSVEGVGATIIEDRDLDYAQERLSAFPGAAPWLIALLGLRVAAPLRNYGMPTADEAGGLADDMNLLPTGYNDDCPPKVADRAYFEETPFYIGCMEPDEVTYYDVPMRCFQRGFSGEGVYLDEEGWIVMFDLNEAGCCRIGTLENFCRFVIACVLSKKSWFDTLTDGDGTEDYDLVASRAMNLD